MLIPEAFKAFDQFIVYRKDKKTPVNPNDLNPSNHLLPENQMTADQALQYAGILGDEYGVGFVFTENDPFFFIDIDKAWNGSDWSDIAKEIVAQCGDAFVEVSQSLTGLHIFGTGTPPENHANKNVKLGLELYTKERFVALTGISARGDAGAYVNGKLNEVADKYFKRATDEDGKPAEWTTGPRDDWDGFADDDALIEHLLNRDLTARQAFFGTASFKDLWTANAEVLGDNYPHESEPYDRSSADAALAKHLAFWTGCDCERMVRLMKRSDLVRDKWTKHRSYLSTTVLSACTGQSQVHKRTQRPQVNDWKALIEQDGANPEKFKGICYEIKGLDLPRVDREMAASMLLETAKAGGFDVTKTAINNILKGEQDEHIVFIDIKGNGAPKATKENLISLMNFYGIIARYNMMSKEIELNIPGKSYSVDNAEVGQVADLISLCERHGLSASCVDKYLRVIGDENVYNPAAEWIKSRQWDGVDRLPALIGTLGAANPSIAMMLLKRYLINGVIAALAPNGVGAAGMIVLQGDQNLGKTRWLKRLFGGGSLFKEACILNPHDKDSVKQAVSYWGVELGELDATFRKADIAALKGFLTKDQDEFRLPYERRASKFSRRTVFAGSVNPKDYLHDDTGNRRFWTIEVTRGLDPDHAVDVQQVWAQASVMWQNGERHYLDKTEVVTLNRHNSEYETVTVSEDLILRCYDPEAERVRPMTTTEIADEIGLKNPGVRELREIGSALRKHFDLEPRKSNGRRVYDLPQKRLVGRFIN